MLHLPRKNEHHLRQLKKSLAAAKNNRFYCQKRLAPITATSEVGAQCIARHRAQYSAVSAMHATQKTPAPDPAQRCNWHACHNLKAAWPSATPATQYHTIKHRQRHQIPPLPRKVPIWINLPHSATPATQKQRDCHQGPLLNQGL